MIFQREASSWLEPHERYRAFGAHEPELHTAYRGLFRYQLDPGLVDEIRETTNVRLIHAIYLAE